MTNRLFRFGILVAAIVAFSGAAAADDFSAMETKLEAALAMDHRSEENRGRDDNRNPVDAMHFCRLRDSMTVIEFGPGSGWYTEILGPALQEKGRLIIVYKDSWMKKLDALIVRPMMHSSQAATTALSTILADTWRRAIKKTAAAQTP